MDRYVNRNASKTAYNNTVKAFEARFDGFEPSNSVKNDDGSEYIIFKNSSGQRVTIDYNAKSNDVSLVCSEDMDIKSIKSFASEYSMKKVVERDPKKDISSVIKYTILPMILLIISLKLNGWYVLQYVFLGIVFWVSFGGLLTITGAVLSSFLAEKDKNRLWRLPMTVAAAFPFLFGAILGAIGNRDLTTASFSDYMWNLTWHQDDMISGLFTCPVTLYLLLLPVIIADDKLTEKRDRITGVKEPVKKRVIYWIASTILNALVVCAVIGTGFAGVKRSLEPLIAEEKSAETIINDRMGKELAEILRYSEDMDYYDFYICPDEEIEQSWRTVFFNDDISVSTDVCGYAELKYNGRDYKVCFKKDGIYLSGEYNDICIDKRGL